ncbi:MAG: hypothetical protein IKL82_03955 [Clostridia bacterium]|nr:hypothetical protein [Clostridia bacterium]
MIKRKELTYMESVHRDGKIWGLVLCGAILLFPIIACIIFNVLPKWSALAEGLIAVMPMYWAVAVIEIITYVPMLGAGGTYLSFVTGNISNLKLPCALNAMEIANVKPSSEEGEIISTISIAVSSIVTTLIIIIGLFAIAPLGDVLTSPLVKSAFDQVLPALFGGLGVVFLAKNLKIAIVPCLLMLVLFIAIPALDTSMVGIMVPVGVVVSIVVARILYKKGML